MNIYSHIDHKDYASSSVEESTKRTKGMNISIIETLLKRMMLVRIVKTQSAQFGLKPLVSFYDTFVVVSKW